MRKNRLHRLHRGVFAVGHLALPPLAAEQAALLACGDGAVLRHQSAAYVWEFRRRPDQANNDPVHVSVLGRALRPRPGIHIHRDRLDLAEIRTRAGLRLTSPARTLIDLAPVSTEDEFLDMLSEARYLRRLRPGELERAVELASGRPGIAAIRAHLAAEQGARITRSRAERLFLKLIRQAGLPPPRTHVRILRHRIDIVWPEQRLIVETDGWDGHGHRSAFERDRRRDAELIAAGWRVLRFTWAQLTEQPLFVIATVAAALAQASARPQSDRPHH